MCVQCAALIAANRALRKENNELRKLVKELRDKINYAVRVIESLLRLWYDILGFVEKHRTRLLRKLKKGNLPRGTWSLYKGAYIALGDVFELLQQQRGTVSAAESALQVLRG